VAFSAAWIRAGALETGLVRSEFIEIENLGQPVPEMHHIRIEDDHLHTGGPDPARRRGDVDVDLGRGADGWPTVVVQVPRAARPPG
jgi:hypothetical protein